MNWIKIEFNMTGDNLVKEEKVLYLLKWGTPIVGRLVKSKVLCGVITHDILNMTHYCLITEPTDND